MFALGVWLIVHAATTSGHDIPFLVTGVALFGMIPIERIALRHQKPPDDRQRPEAPEDAVLAVIVDPGPFWRPLVGP